MRRSLKVDFWLKTAWCSLLSPSCSILNATRIIAIANWRPNQSHKIRERALLGGCLSRECKGFLRSTHTLGNSLVSIFAFPCLVMRLSWVVQGKHTLLFTSISNRVDDLLTNEVQRQHVHFQFQLDWQPQLFCKSLKWNVLFGNIKNYKW